MNPAAASGKKPHRARVLAVACVLAGCAAMAVAQQFPLKDGETVVFYGDSITAQRLYTRDVEDFILTRYPEMHVHFVNAGVPGDTAGGGYTGSMEMRVARDVAPYQPGMITVMLGMNDGGWGYGSPAKIDADFQAKYVALLHALHQAAPHADLTLMCPTPYDEITHGTEFPGYSHMIDQFADDISRMGAQFQATIAQPVLVVDLHSPMVDALKRAKADNPQLAPLLIPDRIHPGKAGHWILAAALMFSWHVNPLVSSVDLDAANGSVIERERTRITQITRTQDGLQWTQTDEALPLPLDFNDAMTLEILRISHLADIDRQMLRVSSLKAGVYELSIDGKLIARFSHERLQSGVNLALFKTPMLSQARDIASNEDQCAELGQARFILGADVKQLATTGIAEATLRAAQEELYTSIRKDLSPMPHHFVLSRVQPMPARHASGGH